MNLDGLTSAYSLVPLSVSPHALLLDPRNPRLITESSQERVYTISEIKSPDVQEYVRRLVCREEHDVKRIISSIEEMGFVGGLHEMIVKDLGDRGPYLVIEGNRRAAALQDLLGRENMLRRDVRNSITKIEVKLFKYRKDAKHSEQTVIDVLLGSIHIDGPKEWGALERAHYVHRSYVRAWGGRRLFLYDVDTAKNVGSSFRMGPKAVHKCLRICRVYEQMRRAELKVEPRHYTLIDLALSTRAVAGPYFELDSKTCVLSEPGLERLAQLILGEQPPIHNPRLFKMFVEVHEDGTDRELNEVSDGGASLEGTCAAIRRRREKRIFKDELEAIHEMIRELPVSEFRRTNSERKLIRTVRKLVEQRLMPLARSTR